MITIEKLKLFEKYRGDDDRFTRASKKESAILSDDEFYTIRRLISDLKMITSGVTAASYEAQVYEQINSLVDSDHTKEYLIKLSTVID
ncbi:MAG: hypothetical protein ACTHMM_03545 [Agriterribacter sp.]